MSGMSKIRRMRRSVGMLMLALAATVFGNPSLQTVQAEELTAGDGDRITSVISPAYRSEINEDTVTVEFYNKIGTSAIVYSQKQPDDLNADSNGLRDVVGEVELIDGYGSVEFQASEYPYGPISLRIQVFQDGTEIDNAYLQLYNHVGVRWKTGLEHAPENPVTAGMDVVFADDFKTMPTISKTGIGTRYASAKIDETRGGMFGWAAFEDYDGPYNPFAIAGDEYMKITTTYHPTGYVRNDYWKQKVSTGFLSSENQAGTGFHTEGGRNQYFEARMFFGPNPGMWPAFWTLTANGYVQNPNMQNEPSDELDIIEGYMGTPAGYQIAWHPWGYDRDPDSGYDPSKLGGGYRVNLDTPAFGHINLAMGFHTLGVYVTKEWTYYYCDNIEVVRHKTLPYSWEYGNYFIINAALSDHYGISPNSSDPFENFDIPDGFTRYGNESETYVDWVRVYQDAPGTARFESDHSVKALAGDVVNISIHRNAPASQLSGTYSIELPDGWKVREGDSFVDVDGVYETPFAEGRTIDTITFLVSNDYTATENINITPVSSDGTAHLPVIIRAEAGNPEGELVRVDRNTYPYRSTTGETSGSWQNYDPDTNLENYFTFTSGNWWRDSWSWMYVAANSNSRLQFTFDGIAVAADMMQCEACGAVDIYLDGELQKRFDGYATDEKPVRAFEKSGLPEGEHTVEIVGVDGPANRYIRIDGFEYRYIEDPTVPKFWADETHFVAGPGDEIAVTIRRNGAAGTKFGEYALVFPSEGWLLWDGDEWKSAASQTFSTNRYEDPIILKVPDGYADKGGKVVITPTTADGEFDPIRITVQAPDAPEAAPIAGNGELIMVDAATYPYVIRPGETNNSWNNFDESSQPIDYFTFNGGWWSDSWSWMYTAASPGQTLTFTFEGDAVALYARYYSGGSRFDVYLDGVKQASVDTNGNSGKRRVFSKSGLPVGVHVLEIKVTGTGGAVALEGFEYDYISAEPPETTGVETVRSGESVLIPARLGKYTFEGKMKVLKSYVPDIKKVESEIMQEVVTVG
ncbi:concanavalin A-like lectin/glucanase domain-containing protein [Paenibacillus sp. 32O-W]|nr:concanavalin A-like lectin/glucanase domain-containing protein [Paenibacillus sp. 32O-W]